MTTLQTGTKLTYQEYLNEPETMLRFDIVDGEVIMSAAPNIYHQRTSAKIYLPVHQFVSERGLGEVLYAPLDIIIQRDPLRTRQPDLLFISNQRANIVQDDRIHGAPDLVVEILSPGNTRAEIKGKLSDYAQIGVLECWLVSPQAQTVEVLQLQNGEWQRLRIHGPGETIQSTTLPGLDLPLSQIFQQA